MMKQLIITLGCSLLLLSSCRVQPTPSYSRDTYLLDYQEAGAGKVFITESNSVSFDYEPIASITAVEQSGYVKVQVQKTDQKKSDKNTKKYESEIYDDPKQTVNTKYKFVFATGQSGLNYAAEQTAKIGGDALINLHIEYTPTGAVYVSGMAVKRIK
jgi:hypothetical protein